MRAVLALLALAFTLYSTSDAAFVCTQADAACTALADLYAATGGSAWSSFYHGNVGWSDAAAGTATSYCSFTGVLCSPLGALTWLCAPVTARRRPPQTYASL